MTAQATVPNANASVSAPTFELLQQQVLQWAATHPGLQGRTLHVVPLDNRIVLQACQQKLQFEQPFVNQPNVRVRCAQPQWQLFVTLGNGATPPSAKTDTPAATALVKVLVAKEVLKRGTIISPDMLVLTEMPASGMENQIIADPQLVVNMELVRDLAPNAPLRTFDLKKAVMVKRGQEVQVTAGAGQGFLITMRAEALQEGALGEQIRLKNSESGRSLTAVVTGQNTARLK
jgi:flagella basal body P-ring formation protein FlgA